MHPLHRFGCFFLVASRVSTARGKLAHQQPHREEDEQRLDVVGALDARREERSGEEEVEREGGRDRSERAGTPSAEDRRGHHDEDEDEREVGVVDLVAQRYEGDRHRDRRQSSQRDREPVRPRPGRSHGQCAVAASRIAMAWATRSPCRLSSRPFNLSSRATSGSGSLSAHPWYPASPACSPATMNGSMAGSTTSGSTTAYRSCSSGVGSK